MLAEVEAEVRPGTEAIMIYTSGSTSDAKGVPHTHGVVMRKVHYLVGQLGIEPGTRSYIASPYFWVGGLTMSLLPVLDSGGTQYCTDRFDAGGFLRLVEAERLRKAVLYPHHIQSLLAHPDFATTDRSSLRDAHPSPIEPARTRGRWTRPHFPPDWRERQSRLRREAGGSDAHGHHFGRARGIAVAVRLQVPGVELAPIAGRVRHRDFV